MTKTARMIEADIKQVDAVAEITDARVPESSRNPLIDELTKTKPRVILLNKCDYADPAVTAEWEKTYRDAGYSVLACDCKSGRGVNKFEGVLKSRLSDLLERRKAKGMFGRALRVMVLGIPNVGKSSFINRMAGSRKTAVGDRPGVTRGKQWIAVGKDAELLDTPGILWHKFEDENAAKLLAFTGAVKDETMDTEWLAAELLTLLRRDYPALLTARYGFDENADGYEMLTLFARKRGMLASGGTPDTERAAVAVLDEFRGGKIGKISLEHPAAV